jgi:hypothetical protein
MIMSAATALAADGPSFRRLRRFTYLLNGLITAFQIVLLATPLFDWITGTLMNLPPEVRHLTRIALWIMLPWPGAIGYRRLYQGVLIRAGFTRRVAYGTVVRLVTMSSVALFLFWWHPVAGAYVGAGALACGVCAEALASRIMARAALRRLAEPESSFVGLGYLEIFRFYLPLALTSTISLAAHPMVTFFMGHAAYSLESLAVLPVVNSLSFIFRSPALAFHDVVIALMGNRWRHLLPLKTFAKLLALVTSLGFALIAFTPLARFWFGSLSGLEPDLISFALPPTRILVLFPALSVLLSFERSILVCGRRTEPISWATAAELVGIALVLWLSIHLLPLAGATCAAIAYLGGRIVGNLMLVRPVLRVLRPTTAVPAEDCS